MFHLQSLTGVFSPLKHFSSPKIPKEIQYLLTLTRESVYRSSLALCKDGWCSGICWNQMQDIQYTDYPPSQLSCLTGPLPGDSAHTSTRLVRPELNQASWRPAAL